MIKKPRKQITLKKRVRGNDEKFPTRTSDPDTPLPDRAWLMLKKYVAMEKPCIFTAYKQAGYEARGASGTVTANEIFNQPNFQKALEEELEFRKTEYRVDAAMVLRNLTLMANANMQDLCTWDDGGVVLKDSATLTRDQSYAIVEVSQTAQGVKVKLESRMRANELLATHLGLLIPDPSKTKNVHEFAQQIKDAVDEISNSVPTAPPETSTPSPEPELEPEGGE